MSFNRASTKSEALARLGRILGETYALGVGSSVPKQLFLDAAHRVGVSTADTMPEIGERIALSAGLEWGPECDSRHTPSGGGSTVTLEGLNRIIEALERRAGVSSAQREPNSHLGRVYRPSTGGVQAPPQVLVRNWDALDESTRAHQELERQLAEFAKGRGVSVRGPADGEAEYDLAWSHEGQLVVVEVKSANAVNHRQQVRLGIGQVIEYRGRLQRGTNSPVVAILLIGETPDRIDLNIGQDTQVLVVGPGQFDRIVNAGLLP